MPGRNAPCPCGSGKKFKKCCALKADSIQAHSATADLTPAIANYESGNFQAAIRAAQAYLQVDKSEPMAWQVLGVSQYYLEDFASAEDAFREVIQRDKRNPDALNNLGLVLFEQGKLDEAEKYCQKALKLQPNMPGAHNNLGNIFRAQGAIKEAENSYINTIKFGMESPEVLCNLGTVLQEQGNNVAARETFEKALVLDEQFVAALSNLGGVLLLEGNLDEAYHYLVKAENLAQDDVDVLHGMANYWHEKGEPQKAEEIFLRTVKLQPNNADVNYRIGFYYQQLSQNEKAKIYLDKAIKINPIHAKALIAVAEIYDRWGVKGLSDEYFSRAMMYGSNDALIVFAYCGYLLRRMRFKEVLSIWERMQAYMPDNPSVMLGLAKYYTRIADYEQAESQFRRLTNMYPNDANYFFSWAEMEESRHKLDEAAELAQRAIEIDPEHFHAHLVLTKVLSRKKQYNEALSVLDKLASKNLDKERQEQPSVFFEKAIVLDKMKVFDEAYEQLVMANKLKSELLGCLHDHEKETTDINDLMEVFSVDNTKVLPNYDIPTKQEKLIPIFIVGFPRSGTTLLEQILASHSLVSPGDELIFLDEMRNKIPSYSGSQQQYPQCLIDSNKPLTQEVIVKLRNYYSERVLNQNFVEKGSKKFTDKMPHNLVDLGLISIVFPEAPIIHITRHPMDSCLSAFMANFDRGHKYTSSMSDTTRHYAALMNLVKHYKSTLDMNYLEIRYEDLVDDTEKNAQKLLKFIDLPWEDECLKFYENKRVSRTASYAQVTQKIYTSSRYRYKNYYKQMEPYAEILSEAMKNFGYTFEP